MGLRRRGPCFCAWPGSAFRASPACRRCRSPQPTPGLPVALQRFGRAGPSPWRATPARPPQATYDDGPVHPNLHHRSGWPGAARCPPPAAEARGWVQVHEFIDLGHSGAKASRPALDRLRAAALAGEVRQVLVFALDRLGRSLRDLLLLFDDLAASGCSVISLRESIDQHPHGSAPGPPDRLPRGVRARTHPRPGARRPGPGEGHRQDPQRQGSGASAPGSRPPGRCRAPRRRPELEEDRRRPQGPDQDPAPGVAEPFPNFGRVPLLWAAGCGGRSSCAYASSVTNTFA